MAFDPSVLPDSLRNALDALAELRASAEKAQERLDAVLAELATPVYEYDVMARHVQRDDMALWPVWQGFRKVTDSAPCGRRAGCWRLAFADGGDDFHTHPEHELTVRRSAPSVSGSAAPGNAA